MCHLLDSSRLALFIASTYNGGGCGARVCVCVILQRKEVIRPPNAPDGGDKAAMYRVPYCALELLGKGCGES